MKKIFFLIATISMVACTKEIPTTEYVTTYSADTTSVTCSDKVLWGEYEVLYILHQYDDGKEMLFTYNSSPYWEERDGEMPRTKFCFTQDKLFISQLMQQGWSEGDVSLQWTQCQPTKVGCKEVIEATETMISWRQDDKVITHYLTKL